MRHLALQEPLMTLQCNGLDTAACLLRPLCGLAKFWKLSRLLWCVVRTAHE